MIVAVTKEIILDNEAIQWDSDLMFTILIACGTSYQIRGSGISVPLDCFVVKDYFLSDCDDRTAIALVGWGPPQIYYIRGGVFRGFVNTP